MKYPTTYYRIIDKPYINGTRPFAEMECPHCGKTFTELLTMMDSGKMATAKGMDFGFICVRRGKTGHQHQSKYYISSWKTGNHKCNLFYAELEAPIDILARRFKISEED